MLKNAMVVLTLVVVSASVLFAGGCRSKSSRAVNVIGSTSIQPFAELLAQEYEKKAPGQRVDVQGGGSTAGLQAVANGLADIGTCSRALKPEEAQQFQGIIIARDGVAVVVNPGNPVAGLTVEQLRNLFAGRITDWKDFGGTPGPIRLITREEGSGTRESFMHLVMEKESIAPTALVQESNGAVKELVKRDPSAIGYMSLGLVGSDLKALCVDGVEASAANVHAGTYKLVRPFLFVTKGTVRPEAQKYIDFVLSTEGQKLLESEGLFRAK